MARITRVSAQSSAETGSSSFASPRNLSALPPAGMIPAISVMCHSHVIAQPETVFAFEIIHVLGADGVISRQIPASPAPIMVEVQVNRKRGNPKFLRPDAVIRVLEPTEQEALVELPDQLPHLPGDKRQPQPEPGIALLGNDLPPVD